MLIDIVIKLKPGGDNKKVVYDVSSPPPIRGVTRGGTEGRETEKQTDTDG